MSDRLDPAREHTREMLYALEIDPEFDPGSGNETNGASRVSEATGRVAMEWARSGAMRLTGWPEGQPEFASGALASAAKGAVLAMDRIAPGCGFAQIDAPALFGERAAIDRLSRRGDISAGGSARLLTTRRGALALNLPRDEDWRSIPAWLESDAIDPARSRDWQRLAQLVADRDLAELIERGRIMGLAIAPATDRPAAMPKPEGLLRPDTHPLLRLRHATETNVRNGSTRSKRLLDLSNLWAGPLATSLLSLAGIEVLKIESPARPDGARHGAKRFFDLMNGQKRGCALDLAVDADRRIFEQLLESADIVVESARPRALAQLGIDASAWVTERSGRIWASITGYGRAREWIAFGDDAAIAAGLAWAPDGSSTRPRFCGDAIADPLGGLHAAAAILAYLAKGRGGLLDLSLTDIAAYAASIEHDGLALAIERVEDEWCVIENERPVPIEKPRARSTRLRAPRLEAPSAELIAAWTRPC